MSGWGTDERDEGSNNVSSQSGALAGWGIAPDSPQHTPPTRPGGAADSGWGGHSNEYQDDTYTGDGASYARGGGGGGGRGESRAQRDFDRYDSDGGQGYRGRAGGVRGASWDRGGYGGDGSGRGRGRGDRGPGGWPNPQEYGAPPHAFGAREGYGSGLSSRGGRGQGRFEGETYYSEQGSQFGQNRGGFGGSRGDMFGASSGRFPRPSTFDMGVTPPDFSKLELAPFERDFYKEHSKVVERTQQEVDEWREKHSVTVDGDAPKPVLTWGETKLPKYVLEAYVVEKGYKAPTTIQCQSIPMALSGRDLIAISETGSGKTLAYAAPAMVHIAAQPPTQPAEGPIALVLAPTRELATQILRECQALGKGGNVRSACAYGGVSRSDQLVEIRKGVDILIATPGRILDYLSAGDVSLERVTFFVLDEADRMISLGFEKEVKQIISMIRPDRQTLMFSATFPPEVRSIAKEFYRDAVTVHLGLDVLTACSNIDQRVEIHRNFGQKIERLQQVLIDEVASVRGKALVFVNKKVMATEVTDFLRSNAIEAISLHGDKRQEERDFALSEFRAGTIPVLVASAVAERGLDIPNVTMVINFDCPQDASSYVHRIGRTGRAGNKGKALTFFGTRDSEGAEKIIEVLASNNVEIPEDLQELAKGYGYSSSLPFSAPPEFEQDPNPPQEEGGWGVTPDGWEVPAADPASACSPLDQVAEGGTSSGWNEEPRRQEDEDGESSSRLLEDVTAVDPAAHLVEMAKLNISKHDDDDNNTNKDQSENEAAHNKGW
ncbi:hypothetical protein JCM3766R1_006125 [Sporobolomyces carnicolor]